MSNLAEQFLALSPERRRAVHLHLAEHALRAWREYIQSVGPIRYYESVCGTAQEVDAGLPADALAAAWRGEDTAQVASRYREPIVAMQAEDLEFPEHITFAYYALYNLFEKYVLHREIDDWLIVNQALSSEATESRWAPMLQRALEQVG